MGSKKLTVSHLKKMINEEKKKLGKMKRPESVETVKDVWSGGKNLVNQIDFIKKLGIMETRLQKRAYRISKAREALKREILKDL